MIASRISRRAVLTPNVALAKPTIYNGGQWLGRRFYAEGHFQDRKKGSIPWMLISVGVTVPAAFYLWRSGPQDTSSHGAGPKRPLVKGPEEGRQVSSEKQSERDPAHAIKPKEDIGDKSGTQTSKQQGVSNDDTMHPDLYAPGKSEKPEGVTDTAKLKGTVSPERGKE